MSDTTLVQGVNKKSEYNTSVELCLSDEKFDSYLKTYVKGRVFSFSFFDDINTLLENNEKKLKEYIENKPFEDYMNDRLILDVLHEIVIIRLHLINKKHCE